MIEIYAHRAIYQNKENTIDGIKNNFELGFNVEIDLRKNSGVIYLAHDPESNGESFEKACEIVKHYSKKMAIHLKENIDIDEIIKLILKYKIEKNCFIFSTTDKIENSKIVDIASYENRNNSPINPILWCDETSEKWYTKEIFLKYQKNKQYVITMSKELTLKSNFQEIKNEWNRLINLGTNGICTDFPNELKKICGTVSK